MGDVTISSGGIWNNSADEDISFGGSLQNNGTFTASTGVQCLHRNPKTFSGVNPISIPSLTVTGTYANNGTLTVGTLLMVAAPGALTNTGTITATTSLAEAGTPAPGTDATLNFTGTSIIPTLTATASPNTVNYDSCSDQTVKATAYHHLTLSGTTTTVRFAGIPSYAYDVQRSTNLTEWITLVTTNAPSNGLFQWVDDFSAWELDVVLCGQFVWGGKHAEELGLADHGGAGAGYVGTDDLWWSCRRGAVGPPLCSSEMRVSISRFGSQGRRSRRPFPLHAPKAPVISKSHSQRRLTQRQARLSSRQFASSSSSSTPEKRRML